MAPLLINTNQMLRRRFNELQRGDIILGRVSLRPSEEHLLLDLVERGVHLIPSALSQLLSRRKTMQSELLAQWLPPRTLAIHDIHQLLAAMPLFGVDEKIVTKLDRKNAGLGIYLWPTIEDVYTHASLANLSFPLLSSHFSVVPEMLESLLSVLLLRPMSGIMRTAFAIISIVALNSGPGN